MKIIRLVAVAAVLLVAVYAVRVYSSALVPVEGDDALPSSTATDWVTYADHLVRIRVDDERRIAATTEELEAGEGVIGRQVTITTEAVLWTRPGFTQPAPDSITWDAGGWAFHGAAEQPLESDGEAKLLPGHRYLVPIVHMALSLDGAGTPVWLPLSGTAMLPFDDGLVGHGERIDTKLGSYRGHSFGRTPMRDSVWGKRAADVVAVLNSTPPDPAAAASRSEAPRVRYQRTLPTQPPAQPGPGEIP